MPQQGSAWQGPPSHLPAETPHFLAKAVRADWACLGLLRMVVAFLSVTLVPLPPQRQWVVHPNFISAGLTVSDSQTLGPDYTRVTLARENKWAQRNRAEMQRAKDRGHATGEGLWHPMGSSATGNLTDLWASYFEVSPNDRWNCKLVKPLWLSVWRTLRKLKINPLCDPATQGLGICPKDFASYFTDPCSTIAKLFATLLTLGIERKTNFSGKWMELRKIM